MNLENISCLFASDLRQGFKHHDGLVGARHDGFGNGDELLLLAEDAQPRRLRFAPVELRRRTGRGLGPAWLKLRQRYVELRAVAHALFDHWQNIYPREIWQQVFEPNEALREFSLLFGIRKFLERDRLLQCEFSHRRARNLREMCAASQL